MADSDGALDLLRQWPVKVAEEILLAPWTVQKVRRSLTDLPDKLDELRAALDRTSTMIDRLLPELSELVVGMDDRFRHVEATVSELGDALLNLMGAIPGVRRALRPPTPPR